MHIQDHMWDVACVCVTQCLQSRRIRHVLTHAESQIINPY